MSPRKRVTTRTTKTRWFWPFWECAICRIEEGRIWQDSRQPDNLQTNSATRPARGDTPRKQAARGRRVMGHPHAHACDRPGGAGRSAPRIRWLMGLRRLRIRCGRLARQDAGNTLALWVICFPILQHDAPTEELVVDL